MNVRAFPGDRLLAIPNVHDNDGRQVPHWGYELRVSVTGPIGVRFDEARPGQAIIECLGQGQGTMVFKIQGIGFWKTSGEMSFMDSIHVLAPRCLASAKCEYQAMPLVEL